MIKVKPRGRVGLIASRTRAPRGFSLAIKHATEPRSPALPVRLFGESPGRASIKRRSY